MADISKISPDAGTTEYNVKDATARSDIASIVEKIPVNASSSNKFATEADIASAYHAAGTKTVAELLSSLLVAANEGNVYNMTDAGTTTADFIEGAGKPIRIGDNVGVCKVGNDYKFDLLSGFIDTSNFVEKSSTSGLLKNDGTVDTTSYVEAETGKGLSTNDYDATAKGIVDSIPLTITQLQGSLLEKFPRSEQRVLGAMNIIPNKAVSNSKNNVTWVVSADKSITISSNNSSADTFIPISSKTQYLLPEGNYILSDECGDSDVYTYIERRKGASGTANYVRTDSSAHSATFTVDYSEYDYYSIDIFVPSGMTFSNKEFKPMIIPSDELDKTYIQPAMTNTGLTRTLEALATIQEGTVTSTFNIDATDKTVKKQGNIVIPCVNIANVTATAYETVVATIPEGFRPSKTTRILVIIAGTPRSAYVESNGNVKLQVGANSERVFISGTCWITS